MEMRVKTLCSFKLAGDDFFFFFGNKSMLFVFYLFSLFDSRNIKYKGFQVDEPQPSIAVTNLYQLLL